MSMKRKGGSGDTKYRIVYPPYQRPDGHGGWDTPRDYRVPDPTNSMWLRLDLSYESNPDLCVVADWLEQVLARELGGKLAGRTLDLLRESRQFKSYLRELKRTVSKRRTAR